MYVYICRQTELAYADLTRALSLSLSHTHTHTHTYIYIHICRQTELAYAYLTRALLLTESSSGALADEDTRKSLRAVSLNNMGCYLERRSKLLKCLQVSSRFRTSVRSLEV
jgi:hypothetical protein